MGSTIGHPLRLAGKLSLPLPPSSPSSNAAMKNILLSELGILQTLSNKNKKVAVICAFRKLLHYVLLCCKAAKYMC